MTNAGTAIGTAAPAARVRPGHPDRPGRSCSGKKRPVRAGLHPASRRRSRPGWPLGSRATEGSIPRLRLTPRPSSPRRCCSPRSPACPRSRGSHRSLRRGGSGSALRRDAPAGQGPGPGPVHRRGLRSRGQRDAGVPHQRRPRRRPCRVRPRGQRVRRRDAAGIGRVHPTPSSRTSCPARCWAACSAPSEPPHSWLAGLGYAVGGLLVDLIGARTTFILAGAGSIAILPRSAR